MSININNKLQNSRKNKVVNKSFDDFRNELLVYAKSSFPDQIKDFSSSSLGGMLIDFAATIGESLSFYLEQQFDELDYEKSNITSNIISHLRKEGIKKNSSSPAISNVTFIIEVPVSSNSNIIEPKISSLPIIKKDTLVGTEGGVNFTLEEDINFNFNYKQTNGSFDSSGDISTLILTKKGICKSGNIATENINFPNSERNDFLTYKLNNEDVIEIIKVLDNQLNEYYEVDFLNQDTIYKKIHKEKEEDLFYVDYAAYRYVTEENFLTGSTTLRFGNGSEKNLVDDILINPEDIALPLEGKGYTSNFSLDPNNLLKSNTFGISPKGKNLQIKYKYGGGSDDNVSSGQINLLNKLNIVFPNSINNLDSDTDFVVNSIRVINEENATGGSDRLSIEELRQNIPSIKKMQNRVISYQDLLARLYSMPSNFGRINKAAVLNNEYTNLSKDLYIICKDNQGFYVNASNGLKKNIRSYLNEFRLIGDSYNIIDTPVYNIGFNISVKIAEGFEPITVINNVAFRIEDIMRFDSFQIGEAINLTDIFNVVVNTQGVVSIISELKDIITIKSEADNFYDEEEDEIYVYSSNILSVNEFLEDNLLYPGRVGIFELKYSEVDINVRNG